MTRYFRRRQIVGYLLMIALGITGILVVLGQWSASLGLPGVREVRIAIAYPGASAEEVDAVVSRRIAEATKGLRSLSEVQSEARNGMALIWVRMEGSGDYRRFQEEIEAAVREIDDFPTGVEEAVVAPAQETEPLVEVVVPFLGGPRESFQPLRQQLRAAGLSLVGIRGPSRRVFEIEVLPEKLKLHGLTNLQVQEALRSTGSQVWDAAGSTGGLGDIERIAVGRNLRDGQPVFLSDVAEVRIRSVDERAVWTNGGPHGNWVLSVRVKRGEDRRAAIDAVMGAVDEERRAHPEVDYLVVANRSTPFVYGGPMPRTLGSVAIVSALVAISLLVIGRNRMWLLLFAATVLLGSVLLWSGETSTVGLVTLGGLALAAGAAPYYGTVLLDHPPSSDLGLRRSTQWRLLLSFLASTCILAPMSLTFDGFDALLGIVPTTLIFVSAVGLAHASLCAPIQLGDSVSKSQLRERSGVPGRVERTIDGLRGWAVDPCVAWLLARRYWCAGAVGGILAVSLVVLSNLEYKSIPADEIGMKITTTGQEDRSSEWNIGGDDGDDSSIWPSGGIRTADSVELSVQGSDPADLESAKLAILRLLSESIGTAFVDEGWEQGEETQAPNNTAAAPIKRDELLGMAVQPNLLVQEHAPLDDVAERPDWDAKRRLSMMTDPGGRRIGRVNGRPTVTIRGIYSGGRDSLSSLESSLIPTLTEECPNVEVSVQEDAPAANQARFRTLGWLLIGAASATVLLSISLGSYAEALLVIGTIAFALTGAIWGHVIWQIDVSIASLVAFGVLAASVVEDATLIGPYAKCKRVGDVEMPTAIGAAWHSQFRAIVLKLLIVFVAVLPLAVLDDDPAHVFAPFAATMTVGLAIASTLILLVSPCLYAVLFDVGLVVEKGWQGRMERGGGRGLTTGDEQGSVEPTKS